MLEMPNTKRYFAHNSRKRFVLLSFSPGTVFLSSVKMRSSRFSFLGAARVKRSLDYCGNLCLATVGVMRFSCVAPAAQFFILKEDAP